MVAERGESPRTWEVWRCRSCGYGWTASPDGEVEVASYYPPSYLGDTHRRMKEFLSGKLKRTRSWERELEKVVLVERFVCGGKLLDVGCSNCCFLLALNSEKWERIGVEYISEVVEIVRSYVPSLEVHPGDIHSVGLENDSLDVITYWHVFEHLHHPRRNLKRTFDLLRPGGYVFMRLPRFDNWQPRTFRSYWYALDVPRHLHHFSWRSLEILLHESAFSDLQTTSFLKRDNFHHIKHSVLRWSQEKFSSRIPYYLLKPVLLGIPLLERLRRSFGMLTVVAKKPPLRG